MITRIGGTMASAVLAMLGNEKHPKILLDDAKAAAFEALAARSVDRGDGAAVTYELPWPKFEYLQWLRAHRPVVFHGTPRDDLETLSTIRKTRDKDAFGDQQALYASDDPVWAMYFAVLRRDPTTFRWTKNSCLRVVDGRARLPRYAFAVNEEALSSDVLGNGTLCILPRATFRSDRRLFGLIDQCHWVTFEEVSPLAKVAVGPADFPFADSLFTCRHTDELRFALAHWRSRLRSRRPQ